MKSLLLLFFFLPLGGVAWSQTETVIHQVFYLDTIESVTLDLYGDYDFQPWAGNTIMSETKIRIFDAPKHVVDFFIQEKERYAIESASLDSTLILTSHDKERVGIQYKGIQCYEEVSLRIFVPDSFEIVSPNQLKKK